MTSKTKVIDRKVLKSAFDQFRNGATIDEVRVLCSVGRNKMIRILKEEFGEEYSKIAKSTAINRFTDSAKKSNTGRKHPPRSKEWNDNISKGNLGKILSSEHKESISRTIKKRIKDKGFWLSKEQQMEIGRKGRETKIKNSVYEEWGRGKWAKGYRHTEKTIKKMSKSKQALISEGWQPWIKGKTHTEETKRKLSKITKSMWKDGKFDNNKGLWRSNLEIKTFEYLEKSYACTHSHRIKSFIYDIFIKELNLIVEVNGDYWHFNPEKYSENYFDKSRNKYAKDVWARDRQRKNLAIESGYSFLELWQNKLEDNFEEYIKNELRIF